MLDGSHCIPDLLYGCHKRIIWIDIYAPQYYHTLLCAPRPIWPHGHESRRCHGPRHLATTTEHASREQRDGPVAVSREKHRSRSHLLRWQRVPQPPVSQHGLAPEDTFASTVERRKILLRYLQLGRF
jgi:hypothetical protein